MLKVMTILGARPQFIKAAAVSRAIAELNSKKKILDEIIVHTGQHYDVNMSDIFFKEMKIPKPNYNLNVNGLSQGAMTGQMIIKLEELMIKEDPNIILLYGDTNSTLAGALTARKLNIPIVHIEGGLRNFDLTIPEDVNRILTDRISDVIFYSTDSAKRNLMQEGFEHLPVKLIRTGDLMADTVFYYSKIAEQESKILDKLNLNGKKFDLLTVHRNSNVQEHNLKEIIHSLNEIAKEKLIVFPIHPNTRKKLQDYNLQLNTNIMTIEPVGYFDMLKLLDSCDFVLTDSGGLQREAYLMKKKSLLLMEYTPWEELIDNGFSSLSKINSQEIVQNYYTIQKVKSDFGLSLYGDGTTAKIIVDEIINLYGTCNV
ncbi:non-hydrolyzing UDP-N-acetylglucosamine 2-epimerase [Aliarcobacter butzleri]|uniref:non-hydrolyzing UDP-N-acetylglucosamine 2-epimerase n=1 Tax=Aliarcobacter butzleri TaxID=28197 RepID=UPI002B23F6E8|nr:UDP-N-acetylglucosamine 2-epimerase (non-hydrolyzing) [Aliarcobacter butzleri]